MESCFSSRPAHPAPQGRGRPRRPLCCELASRGSQNGHLLLGGSWAPSIPDGGWTPKPCMEGSHPCRGLWSLSAIFAFPLALSPPGLPGITSGLNDSLHPTVYVSVFCFSHGYLTHWLSHGLLRLPQHAPGSLCDCPSSSVSFQDFHVPV